MQSKIKHYSDAELLRHWLDFNVSRGDYNNVKRRLVEECLVTMATFNNWLYGRCRIPHPGKRDINRVTLELSGKEIFPIVSTKELLTLAKPGGYSAGVCGESSGEAI